MAEEQQAKTETTAQAAEAPVQADAPTKEQKQKRGRQRQRAETKTYTDPESGLAVTERYGKKRYHLDDFRIDGQPLACSKCGDPVTRLPFVPKRPDVRCLQCNFFVVTHPDHRLMHQAVFTPVRIEFAGRTIDIVAHIFNNDTWGVPEVLGYEPKAGPTGYPVVCSPFETLIDPMTNEKVRHPSTGRAIRISWIGPLRLNDGRIHYTKDFYAKMPRRKLSFVETVRDGRPALITSVGLHTVTVDNIVGKVIMPNEETKVALMHVPDSHTFVAYADPIASDDNETEEAKGASDSEKIEAAASTWNDYIRFGLHGVSKSIAHPARDENGVPVAEGASEYMNVTFEHVTEPWWVVLSADALPKAILPTSPRSHVVRGAHFRRVELAPDFIEGLYDENPPPLVLAEANADLLSVTTAEREGLMWCDIVEFEAELTKSDRESLEQLHDLAKDIVTAGVPSIDNIQLIAAALGKYDTPDEYLRAKQSIGTDEEKMQRFALLEKEARTELAAEGNDTPGDDTLKRRAAHIGGFTNLDEYNETKDKAFLDRGALNEFKRLERLAVKYLFWRREVLREELIKKAVLQGRKFATSTTSDSKTPEDVVEAIYKALEEQVGRRQLLNQAIKDLSMLTSLDAFLTDQNRDRVMAMEPKQRLIDVASDLIDMVEASAARPLEELDDTTTA